MAPSTPECNQQSSTARFSTLSSCRLLTVESSNEQLALEKVLGLVFILMIYRLLIIYFQLHVTEVL